LTSDLKKIRLFPDERHQLLRPRLLGVEQIHRGDDVDQHSPGEEDRELLRIDARDTLDGLDDIAVALLDDLTDLGVVARRVALELPAEPEGVRADQLPVRGAHRIERLLTGLTVGRPLEEVARLAEATLGRREEELLLRPEEAKEVGLRDAGL